MHCTVIVATLFFAAYATAAVAQEKNEKSCIAIEVNGIRTLPYECLSAQLLPLALRTPVVEGKAPGSARSVMRPSNELGLFNRSATAIRMGSNFGHSAQPQRPPLSTTYSPLVSTR
ncbi:hypothetical protein [Comamonas sp. GB3 AK4-5]|uniref:hypothetical protein n=1 Tax=Comamonas sp. GB3 AK4-5 TaxID=3231487 RepID=UPI00351DEACE